MPAYPVLQPSVFARNQDLPESTVDTFARATISRESEIRHSRNPVSSEEPPLGALSFQTTAVELILQ